MKSPEVAGEEDANSKMKTQINTTSKISKDEVEDELRDQVEDEVEAEVEIEDDDDDDEGEVTSRESYRNYTACRDPTEYLVFRYFAASLLLLLVFHPDDL